MNLSDLPIRTSRLIALLGLLVAFGPFAIDMYLPNLPVMGHELGVGQDDMQHTLSAFLLGFCVGMLFYGPLSDRFGRRPLLLVGIGLYVVSSLLCAFAHQIDSLIAFRLLQAIGGGAGSVMARAIVRDVFPKEDAASVLSKMALVTMVAPLIAPLVGGWLGNHIGWRAVFVLLSVQGFISGWLVWRYLPETLPPTQRSHGGLGTVLVNYWRLLIDPRNLLLIIGMGFPFAGMFAFITGSPFVYIERFGVNNQFYGFLFGANIIGQAIFTLINTQLLKRYSPLSITNIAILLALTASIGALLTDTTSLWLLVPMIVVYVGLTIAINANTMAALLGRHQHQIGSISALAVSIEFGFGSLASFIVAALQPHTPHAMTSVMLGCAVIAAICLFVYRWLETPQISLQKS